MYVVHNWGRILAFDPVSYATNNYVSFHKPSATPCPWCVMDWTELLASGLTFDFADSMLGASASGSLSFTKSPDISAGVCLDFSEGRIYAWGPKGTALIFR